MKISIITATYNCSDTIIDCIASVNEQTYENIEHIIIDGGSSDCTLRLIKNGIRKNSKVISAPDEGIYDALNKGIELATGDIIGLLHSDDTFASSQTLEHIANAFLLQDSNDPDHKRADVVYGDLVFTESRETSKIVRFWVSKPFTSSMLNQGWMLPHLTVFFRRFVYEKHGLYNIKLKCSADYDYLLRVFKDPSLQFFYIPETITRMRMGGISTGGLGQILNKKLEDFWVLKHNKMPSPFWILLRKNYSKIPQLFVKKLK